MVKEVSIEVAKEDFFEFFFQIKMEDKNILWSGHDQGPDYDNLKQWFLSQLSQNNRIIFAIKYNNNFAGYLYLDNEKNGKSISYGISTNFEGKGIASKSIHELINYLKREHISRIVLNAYVSVENIASIKALRNNSFYKGQKTYEQFFKSLNRSVIMQEYIYNPERVFIIAEAGVNHNGQIGLAKQLIDEAVNAGADAVKFQTWKTDLLVSKESEQAQYQEENTGYKESQYDMLKKLELSYEDFKYLQEYCDEKKIMFLSTPDETTSADFLNNLQKTFKIGSGELTNIPFLKHIGNFGKKIILSTGMSNLGEIEKALLTLIEAGTKKEDIIVLHATTQYPTPIEDVNLRAMITIRNSFNIQVGYSDHTMGIEIPIAAVALGAKVIEKHFTLSREMKGPDHKASLEPNELKLMVSAIRNVEQALGDGEKKAQTSEIENKKVVRKSIVAKNKIQVNEIFTEDNLTTKRVGNGISSALWDEIIGLKANVSFEKNELIRL